MMEKIIKYFGIILLFATTLSLGAQQTTAQTTVNFENYIQAEMRSQKIPAMSALIFNKTDILYENYFGKSQLQKNIPLQKDHVFLLASISKVITATALLQLYEAGRFSLDDNINDYLPFKVKIPDYSKNITFRMLLTHTSAIADGSALEDQYYFGKDSPVALRYFLQNYLTPKGKFYDAYENFHDFAPGSDYEYSNIGNALIGLLVEEISGMNFNTYSKRNIFAPLGMTQTHWRLGEITQTIVRPYNYKNGRFKPIQHYTFTDYPNGGLRSNGRDMFKFLSAFVNGGISNKHRLLAASTIKSMITPQIPALDKEVGLHLFLMNRSYGLWGHAGGEQGVAIIMAFNPKSSNETSHLDYFFSFTRVFIKAALSIVTILIELSFSPQDR
jgi:CubicO group peptidase (beta-lactamase class C family)